MSQGNGKLFNASVCLSDLLAKAKEAHSAYSKSEKNGKIYVNIQVWVNDDEDKFGNKMSLQLNSKDKESREQEGKVYVGNGKEVTFEKAEPKDLDGTEPDLDVEDDDLPF